LEVRPAHVPRLAISSIGGKHIRKISTTVIQKIHLDAQSGCNHRIKGLSFIVFAQESPSYV
jgi:hypothetical protein